MDVEYNKICIKDAICVGHKRNEDVPTDPC